MKKNLNDILKSLSGDYGKALRKLFETTGITYQKNLNELKKLSALLEDNLNQTTLRGICKMVSEKYAITEKLKEALELNKVSNTPVKQAIETIEQFDQSMIMDAETTLLEGDGRLSAAQHKIWSELGEIYNAVEQIISSETPAPTLLEMANNIADKLQVGLGELISNNQMIVDAFQTMISQYINNVESQISIIRTQEPRFMQEEIEANADKLNQEWYPLRESIQFNNNIEKYMEELNRKVNEIWSKIQEIGDDTVSGFSTSAFDSSKTQMMSNGNTISENKAKEDDEDDKGGKGGDGTPMDGLDRRSNNSDGVTEAEEEAERLKKENAEKENVIAQQNKQLSETEKENEEIREYVKGLGRPMFHNNRNYTAEEIIKKPKVRQQVLSKLHKSNNNNPKPNNPAPKR